MLSRLRRACLVIYYRGILKSVGKKFRIGEGSQIVTPGMLSVGHNCFFGPRFYLSSPEEVRIGNNVMFGPEVMILGGDHDFATLGVPMRFSPNVGRSGPIIIEDDVWVGARCLLIKGVRLGTGSVIGAGSVVTHSLPPFSVAAGNPCRVIRTRFSEAEMIEHRRALDVWRSQNE